MECFDRKNDQEKKQPPKEQIWRRKKLTLTSKLGIQTFDDEPLVRTLLKRCSDGRTYHNQVNNFSLKSREKGTERRKRTVVRGKRTGSMITETMGVEQVDMRYTQPEAAPTLPRTTGELELDNLPAIETSTARVDGQVFASNLGRQMSPGQTKRD